MIDHSKVKGITLIPTKSVNTIEELGTGVCCDFYVEAIEQRGEEVIGGYRYGNLMNIDHHAPTARMARIISSTPLAIAYCAEYGVSERCRINHTDTDSVLSSGITVGALEPDECYAKAAIAADHTGEENTIADLLNSIGRFSNLTFSFHNLELLLRGKPLEPEAQEMLAQRKQDREFAETLAKRFTRRGRVQFHEGLYFSTTDLLLPHFPDAEVVLLHYPAKVPGKYEIRLRLGPAAPEGLWLNKLGLPNFGGRWNAGSSRRSKKTTLSGAEYADIINTKIEEFLKNRTK